MLGSSAGADGRRRRSAKARSRGNWGRRVERALWRFDGDAGIDCGLAIATDVHPNTMSARVRAEGTVGAEVVRASARGICEADRVLSAKSVRCRRRTSGSERPSCERVSLALHPPRRHLEPPTGRRRRRPPTVTFKYKDYRVDGLGRFKVMMLATGELRIRRFLLPRPAKRLPPHPPLRDARQRLCAPTASPRPESCSPCPHRSPSPNRRQHENDTRAFTHARVPAVAARMLVIEVFARGSEPSWPSASGPRPTSASSGSTRHDRASPAAIRVGSNGKSLANCRHRPTSPRSIKGYANEARVCRGAAELNRPQPARPQLCTLIEQAALRAAGAHHRHSARVQSP